MHHADLEMPSITRVDRVLAIDGQPLVIHGLRAVLAGRDDAAVTAWATTIGAAREIIPTRAFEVAIVGVRLPGGSGLPLIESIRCLRCSVRVIALADATSARQHEAAIASGADDVIDRTVGGHEILAAIQGRRDPARAGMPTGHTLVTPRQRQIVVLLAGGRSNDEIANDLGIAPKTVETQLSRLYQRFELQGRIELLLLAQRSGWLPPERATTGEV